MIDVARNWLLLIHRLPPEPAYLRVKVSRRLQKVGAVALKNTVYVMPHSKDAREDFQWIAQEIRSAGGEAVVGELRLVDGITDREVEDLFRAARQAELDRIDQEAGQLPTNPHASDQRSAVRQLERRLAAVKAVDFFGTAGMAHTSDLLQRLRSGAAPQTGSPERGLSIDKLRGLTWVTRSAVRVDRIASAWLVRRFVDAGAVFRFVDAKACRPAANEIRFDMFEGELTHEGECCTFEVIVGKLALTAPGLRAVAEIVHDVDIKDGRYGRPETDGVAALIAGICQDGVSDEDRLARGFVVFDGLLAAVASGAERVPSSARNPRRMGVKE